MAELDSKLDATKRRIEVAMQENLEEGTSSGSGQITVNANMKQEQMMMFGSSIGVETQTQTNLIPYQNLQVQTMDHHELVDHNNLSQIQLNYGSFQSQNIYNNFPTMTMEKSQNYYSMFNYGVPLPVPSYSVLPLPYMQLSDDQVMMANASSNSHQMGLANNINAASAQLNNDHFDYVNYDQYFMNTNNF